MSMADSVFSIAEAVAEVLGPLRGGPDAAQADTKITAAAPNAGAVKPRGGAHGKILTIADQYLSWSLAAMTGGNATTTFCQWRSPRCCA